LLQSQHKGLRQLQQTATSGTPLLACNETTRPSPEQRASTQQATTHQAKARPSHDSRQASSTLLHQPGSVHALNISAAWHGNATAIRWPNECGQQNTRRHFTRRCIGDASQGDASQGNQCSELLARAYLVSARTPSPHPTSHKGHSFCGLVLPSPRHLQSQRKGLGVRPLAWRG